ncbi:SCO family protein [Magnetococcus sp. PR-3]|uniref:SCO family protein n=1 Tax=Magnetococcus sp. PR-3 TaxID=3120355 RepID=UPI002FCE4E3F
MVSLFQPQQWSERRKQWVVGLLLLFNVVWVFAVGLVGFQGDANGVNHEHQPLDLPLLRRVKQDEALLYLGFVGCGVSCPTALQSMADVRLRFEQNAPRAAPALLFVNILSTATEAGVHQPAEGYAQSFHDAFLGFEPMVDNLPQINRALDVTITPNTMIEDQSGHTGFIYLLQRQAGRWYRRGTYLAWPPDAQQIFNAVQQLQDNAA